ncbi:MAG: cytochrome c family protein [Alphaproteobacteria bacterium]|nr:cytochrome c family protein [Alphaproteobacteria bacterium]
MDSFEFNKIAGSVLFTLLVYLGVQNLADILFHPQAADPNAYIVEGVGTASAAINRNVGADEAEEPDIMTLLATASVEKGERVAKKCISCHAFSEGAPHGTGPNLYDIVNRDIASLEGFNYSNALQDLEGVWDYHSLSAFLASPRKFAKGTKMSFIGLKKPKDRANMIAYLRSVSANPPPLPAQ